MYTKMLLRVMIVERSKQITCATFSLASTAPKINSQWFEIMDLVQVKILQVSIQGSDRHGKDYDYHWDRMAIEINLQWVNDGSIEVIQCEERKENNICGYK